MQDIRDPIDRILEKLRDSLIPFVEGTLSRHYPGQNWVHALNSERKKGNKLFRNPTTGRVHWSPDDILNTIVIGKWAVFKDKFKHRGLKPSYTTDDYVAKGWIEELMEMRKRAAHQEPITVKDVARFVDTAELVLRAANADAAADELHELHPYVEGTRLEYWTKNIESIISTSEMIVVLDSYQGHKHLFWQALNDRVKQPAAFHLIFLILRKGDPFLNMCLNSIGCPTVVTDLDLELINNLKEIKEISSYRDNKTLEFLYWEGFSPGPLLVWKEKGGIGTEKIALGFWLQVEGATDNVPYVAVSQGPLFEALRNHYIHIVENARQKVECRI
jgi:hypothetical protein